jgi:phosphoribosylformylglycinamidine synthase
VVRPEHCAPIEELARQSDVDLVLVGTMGGTDVTIAGLVNLPVDRLRNRHESWFPEFMDDTARSYQAAE